LVFVLALAMTVGSTLAADRTQVREQTQDQFKDGSCCQCDCPCLGLDCVGNCQGDCCQYQSQVQSGETYQYQEPQDGWGWMFMYQFFPW
jgi:hypothetical protein